MLYFYDRGKELEEAGIPNPYSRQGEEQPFGYTGYRYDSISDTYFAQAREYRPENGRFTAEDVIKGNGLMPQTLNPYIYCRNNPLALVDLDGLLPAWLNGTYAHSLFETEFMILYDETYGIYSTETLYGEKNVPIPEGGRYGLNGVADIILHKGNNVEIYEIKPISNYHDFYLREKGEGQLGNYIAAYKKINPNVDEGERKYVESLLDMGEMFPFEKNKNIKYMMFPDSPGMIYYEILDKENGKNEPAFDMVVSQKEITEVEQVGMVAVFGSILGSLKEGTVAVANGLLAPFIMFDEILEQNLKRINGCTHEDKECTCVA